MIVPVPCQAKVSDGGEKKRCVGEVRLMVRSANPRTELTANCRRCRTPYKFSPADVKKLAEKFTQKYRV